MAAFCNLNVSISFCLNNITSFLLHSFHDHLDQCLLVCPIRQEVVLFPRKYCRLGNVHLVYIQLLTSPLMHTVLYTWSNLITIKHHSRSSIVFDSEWGIIVSNQTICAPRLPFQTLKKISSVKCVVLCDWNSLLHTTVWFCFNIVSDYLGMLRFVCLTQEAFSLKQRHRLLTQFIGHDII